jgi:nitroreductase
MQPTQIIVVQDVQLKEKIAQTAMIGKGNQYRTRDCSALVVFCSDLQPSLRLQRIVQLERNDGRPANGSRQQRHPDYLAMMPISTSFMFGEGHAATMLKQATMDYLSSTAPAPMPEIDPVRVWAYKNTSLMVQSYVLAATSYNLHTSIMEGYDPRRMKELLHVPYDRYGIPMVVATGYEYIDETVDPSNTASMTQTARLDMKEVVFHNTFGVPIDFTSDLKGNAEDIHHPLSLQQQE